MTGEPLPLHELPEHGSARAIAFIETYCRVPKGGPGNPAGALIRLRPWQRQILESIYDPVPRPRQGLVSVARKNGKSLLGAAIALYALLADGEESGEVLLASSDQRTAEVIFKVARRMVELDERLSGVVQIFQDRLYVPDTDSILEPLPANARNLQGRNPHLSLIDETHVTDPDTWDALALAGGTRARPLILGLSTECGDNDPDNLMVRLVEHGREGQDPSFAFTEYTAPVGCDLGDLDAWAAANPMLGDTLDEAHLMTVLGTTREASFRRFHLNQRVRAAGTWLPTGAWDACLSEHAIADGAEVVIAVDGSYSTDSTALIVGTVEPVPHFSVLALFEQPEGDDDWRVPLDQVMDAIRDACKKFKVLEVVFDPFRFAMVMNTLEAEGFPVVQFPWSAVRITPATADLTRAILGKQITHDGDVRLARHVGNAVLRETSKGVQIDKVKRRTKQRIDCAAALLMCHSRAVWRARKTKRKKVRSFAS